MYSATRVPEPIEITDPELQRRRERNGKRKRRASTALPKLVTILRDPTGCFGKDAQFTLGEFVAGFVRDEIEGTIVWPEGMTFTRKGKVYRICGERVVTDEGGQVNISRWNYANFKIDGCRRAKATE